MSTGTTIGTGTARAVLAAAIAMIAVGAIVGAPAARAEVVPTSPAPSETPPADAPPAPTDEVLDLTAAIDIAGILTLSWRPPASASDEPVLDYLVASSPDAGATWAPHPDPVTAETGATAAMPPGSSALWRVQVVTAVGVSAGAIVAVAAAPEPPVEAPNGDEVRGSAAVEGAPSPVQSLAARTVGARTLTAEWRAPASRGASALTDYRIAISDDGGATWTAKRDPIGAVTRYTFTVPSGTELLVRVVAVNAQGASEPAEIAITTPTLSPEAIASEEALRAALLERIGTLPGRYSVSVREIGGLNREVHIDAMRMQEPASVMKLFAAYVILDRVERGALSLAAPTRSGVSIGSCLRVMIHISDNLCHWDLVSKLGNQRINDTLAFDGFVNSVYQGRSHTGAYFSSKRTTSSNVSLMLQRLETDTLIAEPQADHLRDLLLTQLWRHRVPSGVPVGVPVANKTGQLWVSSGMIEADAAIVYGPEATYAISIFGSQNATADGVRRLGQIAYQHLNGPVEVRANYWQSNLVTTGTAVLYRYAGRYPLRSVPAGTLLAARYSARTWYQVTFQNRTYYVRSSIVRNRYDYPRPASAQ